MQFTVNMPANQWVRQQTAGRFFMVVEDDGQPVELRLAVPLQADEEVSTARKGFKARLLAGQKFTHIDMRTPAACTLVVIVSDNDVDFNFFEGASVNATVVNPLPLPVVPDRGAPANPVYVSGLTYSDAPATSLIDRAAVAVAAVAVAVLAADVTRKAARFTNIGADPVALGAAGITWAKRCIILNPGDVWVEERGANLAWYAICDAAKTASVTAQEVLA